MRKIILVAILLALLPNLAHAQEREPLGIHQAVVWWDYVYACPYHTLEEEMTALFRTFNFQDDTVIMEVLAVDATKFDEGWLLFNIAVLVTFKDDAPQTSWDVDRFVYDLILESGFYGYITRSVIISHAYATRAPREEGGY